MKRLLVDLLAAVGVFCIAATAKQYYDEAQQKKYQTPQDNV